MKLSSFIRDLWKKFPLLLVGNTLVLLGESLMGTVAILAIAPVIDCFINPELQHASPVTRQVTAVLRSFRLPATLGSFLAVLATLQLLKNGLAIFSKYCLLRTRLAVLRDLTLGSFEDFFNARWAFFSSQKQGTILNTFLHEIAIVGDAFGQLTLCFASLIQLVCYLAVPFYLSWQVTAVSLATALVLAWPLLLLGKVTYRLGQRTTTTANALGAVIQESVTLAKIILGFGHQRQALDSLGKTFDAHRRVVLASRTLTTATPLLYEPLGVLVLVVSVLAAQRFRLPLSETAVLLWTLRNAIPLLGGLASQRNALANFLPSYEQIQSLRRRAKALRQPSGIQPLTGFQKGIAMEHVTFAYPGHEPVLVDLSLVIPNGRMIAFVGESGVGKSTLIDLLMGFHQPTAGRITVDGVPLQELEINSYRRRVGYVPQESVLFNTTIRENLRWANDAATDEEIAQACRQASADEFIERLPDGYDTVVGDRGMRLSGGQCQRVALARALLRRPALLILDEATSALDTESERLIQQAIETVAKDTTVIVIAHRLSTIVNADYVYVLHQGRVVEAGTCPELAARNGRFSRMTRLQVLEPIASPQPGGS